MQGIVDENSKLILNCILLALYGLLLLFGFVRLFLAYARSRKYLIKFFILVLTIIALELAIQIYQVVQE